MPIFVRIDTHTVIFCGTSVRIGNLAFEAFWSNFVRIGTSDVPAPAWPESPGFGLALDGSGFVKSQAGPKAEKLAWPGLALA
jgi:hypothetical protein